jgi:predicted transcriptional regulator
MTAHRGFPLFPPARIRRKIGNLPVRDKPFNSRYLDARPVSGVRNADRSREFGEFVATTDPIELAAEIVAAFVSYNSLPMSELPALIEAIHATVKSFAEPEEVAAAVIDRPALAVSIRKSVTPDYLICLEDGKRFKSLRRHLTTLGMTPEQYRAKWNLPFTYPMVAPNYAAQRSAMATSIGFGRRRQEPVAAAPATGKETKGGVVASPPQPPAKRKPGRPRKPTA